MTAYQLIQYASQGLYVLIFALALVSAVRRPRGATIDITLLFGTLTLVILATWIFSAFGITPPRLVVAAQGVVFLAMPYLLLRLVDRFLGAPSWLLRLALVGLALCGVALFVSPTPAPTTITLGLIAYFAGLTFYVTVRFVNAARSSVGTTARRMQAAATGTLFLTITLVIRGIQAAQPEWLGTLQIITGLAFLASGIAYFVGFTPPAWLRNAWRERELRYFMQRSVEAADQPETTDLVRELEENLATTIGVHGAFVGIWNESDQVLEVQSDSSAPRPAEYVDMPGISVGQGIIRSPAGAGLLGRCFSQQRPIYSENPSKDAPEFGDAYRRSGVRSLLVAPMTHAGERFGVLGVFTSRPPLFGEDDLELVDLMARHAALVFRNRSLMQRIGVLNAQQELAQFKDAFLASVTHDLKTPITSIRGVAQWVRRRSERHDAIDAQSLTGDMLRIEGASDKMIGLVNQLLDISRIQMGRPLELARSSTDLVTLAKSVVAEHQGMTSRHQISIESSTPELVGRWDGVRLERVLSNLVDNAVKYSPNGGDILVRLEHQRVDGAELAVIHVRDSGIGIPTDDLPRIFDRFERGGNASSLGIPGTGIGLAYVLEVVDTHGGRVTVDSSEGQGATFSVLLPLEGGGETTSVTLDPKSRVGENR